MRLQKHERQAVEAVRRIAAPMGVDVRVFRRGSHPVKMELTAGGGRQVIGLPSSPRDRAWSVRVAARQAGDACRRLIGA